MVDRSVKVFLKGDISDYNRAMLEASAGSRAFSKELDSNSGRMAILTQSALALGPALIPITTAAVPAMAGLANQLGIGAAGAGVAVLAFKGLGKALDAVNAYSLQPTATNLENMQKTLGQMGPAGRDFVLFLQSARPGIQHLQEIARGGLFPGVEEGLRSLSGLLPDVEHIIGTISTTLGDLASEAGANLNSPKWHEFIAFLDKEARPTLLAMGRTAGNFAEGLANLWMAFAPLSNNFSQDFLGLARDFAKWTDGLDKTQGFQDFVAYIARTGPEAFHTLGSLANAVLQIVEAAAPIGEATLPIIKDLADAISALADSDLGPVIVGVTVLAAALTRLRAAGLAVKGSAVFGSLFGPTGFGGAAKAAADLPAATRAYLTLGSSVQKTGYQLGQFSATSERLGTSLKGTAKLAGAGAGLAFAMSGLADKAGLSNTVMGAMAGSVIPGVGTAVGATAGAFLDLRSQVDLATQSAGQFEQAFANAGSLDKQAAVIAEFKRQLSALEKAAPSGFGGEIGKLKDSLAGLEDQQAKGVRAAQDSAFAEANLSSQMSGASQSTRDETFALLQNIAAKNQAADATENAFSAETNYRKALLDAQKQAKSNNAGIDANNAAANANRDSLDQLATAWNRVADSGNATGKDLKNARANFIRVAEGMGVSTKAAGELFDSLRHLPSPKVTVTVAGLPGAQHTVQQIKTLINGVHGKTVYIKTVHTNSYGSSITGGGRTGTTKADGGLILGPGGPRDDLVPIMASNREFIVNAAATSRFLPLLHQINNSQRFADGGQVLQRMAPAGYLAPGVLDVPGSSSSPAWSGPTDRQIEDAVRKGLNGATLKVATDSRTLLLKTRGA